MAGIGTSIVHAVAGGLGSSFSITVFYPFETARARLQVDDKRQAQYSYKVIREIIKDEGMSGLYRGWCGLVLSLFISNFIYFYVFHCCKLLLESSAMYDLILGTFAGVVTVLFTCPLWAANTRLKFQGAKMKTKAMDKITKRNYSGIVDCIVTIAREESVSELYKGLVPSLVLVTSPGLQFMFYETLKRNTPLLLGAQAMGGVAFFIIGAVSKCFSTVLTYPLQVVQSRLMTGLSKPAADQKYRSGAIGSFLEVYNTHGLRGFYRGFESKLTQTVLTAALMFLAYEKISGAIFGFLGLKMK